MDKFCPNCGKELKDGGDVCLNCGKMIKTKPEGSKSKVVAGLFGIFLGSLGVHNFYLGYTGKALAQLLMTLLSFGFLGIVSAVWGLVEGIMILTGSINQDANGNSLCD
jgi:TM2 domain-containing membrane protein YozV